jgi:hypothetical protein
MDHGVFTRLLSRLSESDIRSVAAEIDAHHCSAADDVAWWQATLQIDRALKAAGCTREAAMAALAAAKAVQSAALSAGLTLPDDRVTVVARAAAEVARGLVAGEAARDATATLLVCWRPVLARFVQTAA